MEKLIKALEEKNIPKRIQQTVNVFQFIKEGRPKDWLNKSVEVCLDNVFKEDAELTELFAECCFDLAMKTLVEKLAIKPDPNYKLTNNDVFALALAQIASDNECDK